MAFSFPLKSSVQQALSMLEENGFEAYVVGGCVRDFLLGAQPHDFDICSAARTEEVKEVFRDYDVIPTGEKHGTVTVILEKEVLEITTFRKDGDYLDGRHPEQVLYTSAIEEDLMRRDFTINAMAYSPLRGLKDPFCGQADLQRGLLRCVGEAEKRFTEDALRLLRALRFAARLRFAIEKETAAALHRQKDTLSRVSRERVAAEINGLLLADGCRQVMEAFSDVVFAAVPGLADHPCWHQALQAVEKAPGDLPIRWAALLAGLGEDRARDVLKTLKMSNHLTDTVCTLVRYAFCNLTVENTCWMLSCIGMERFAQLLVLQQALGCIHEPEQLQKEARRIGEKGVCFTLSQLAVRGSDLLALGIQGRDVGDVLQALLTEVVWYRLPNEKETLLSEALPLLRKMRS